MDERSSFVNTWRIISEHAQDNQRHFAIVRMSSIDTTFSLMKKTLLSSRTSNLFKVDDAHVSLIQLLDYKVWL